MTVQAAEVIDRLITIETIVGLPRQGFIRELYEAARAKYQQPLTHLAAASLCERLAPGAAVLLVTGAGVQPFFPAGETDGPVGLAVLARALQQGLGAKPVLVAAPHYLQPFVAAGEAAELVFVSPEEDARRGGPPGLAVAEAFPLGFDAGAEAARRLLDRYHPAAIIASELLGPNRHGVIHSRTGIDISNENPYAHHLFTQGAARGILTISLGDGGNEVGWASLRSAVEQYVPYATACRCPCGGGIADATECDLPVVANISDWAAYGTAAALAVQTENRSLLPDGALLGRVLDAVVQAGAVDGATCRHNGHVDGTRPETQLALLALLHQIVENALRKVVRPY